MNYVCIRLIFREKKRMGKLAQQRRSGIRAECIKIETGKKVKCEMQMRNT